MKQRPRIYYTENQKTIMWERWRKGESLTEHDLRAKCASDATSLEHARALLSHADDRMTKRAYRRAPERVRPLR